MIPKIKICGITSVAETEMLHRARADFAGFVLAKGSKRTLTLQKAGEIKAHLAPEIRSVAVDVSPTLAKAREIERAGFGILQVHGTLDVKILTNTTLQIWRAVNIKPQEDANDSIILDDAALWHEHVTALVIDAAEAGSGKTFCWSGELAGQIRAAVLRCGKELVLAGGLNEENVAKGISLFAPHIVDVSSGVEREHTADVPPGKDEEKLRAFVRTVRNMPGKIE